MVHTTPGTRSQDRDQFDPETASDAQRLAKIVTLIAKAKRARRQGKNHDAYELLQSAVTVAGYLPDELREKHEESILALSKQWRRLAQRERTSHVQGVIKQQLQENAKVRAVGVKR